MLKYIHKYKPVNYFPFEVVFLITDTLNRHHTYLKCDELFTHWLHVTNICIEVPADRQTDHSELSLPYRYVVLASQIRIVMLVFTDVYAFIIFACEKMIVSQEFCQHILY